MKNIKKTRQKLSLLAFRRAGGFTLFELLVTISIVAVLTAVAMVSYGGLNKKTRDSRRMADLEKIRISLEAFRQIGSSYPSSLNNLVGSSLLQIVPKDPKTGAIYPYVPAGAGYTYQVGASMEDLGSTNTATVNIGGTNCNYRLMNP